MRAKHKDYSQFEYFVRTRRMPFLAACYLFREQIEAFAEKEEHCYLVVNETSQPPLTGVYAFKDKIHPRIAADPRHADFRKYVHRVCHGETLVLVWLMKPPRFFTFLTGVPWATPGDRVRTVLKNVQVTDKDEIAAFCAKLGV